MGSWDVEPWDNDKAADWFGDLWDQAGLVSRVDEALQLNPVAHHEKIRAAASLLLFLGRPYVWPIDALDRQLKLAIEKLELISCDEVYPGEYVVAIKHEIALLTARLERRASPDDADSKQWWLRLR